MKHDPILLIVSLAVGFIMLLPGGCAILTFTTLGLPTCSGPTELCAPWYIFWFICFAISALGVYLLLRMFR